MLKRGNLVLLSIVLFLMHGCVGVQTFPGAARAGDTITLAIGSLEGANKNNLSINFTSNVDASIVDLTPSIRSVFNLYADKTSQLNIENSDTTLGAEIYRADAVTLASAHSAWITVAVVDLPTGLTLGSGKINVVFGAGITPANLSMSADQIDIGVEILAEVNPGDAAPNPFEYVTTGVTPVAGNLNSLEPMKQVLVRSPRQAATTYEGIKVYAAEFILSVPLQNTINLTAPVPDQGLMVIRDVNRFDYVQSADVNGVASSTAAQTQMSWKRNGDTVIVSFISHTGQLNDNLIRFSLVPYPPNDFASMPVITSSRYFDQDGAVMAGMSPIIEQLNF